MRKLYLDGLRNVLLNAVFEHQPIQNMFLSIYDCIRLPLNAFDTSFKLIANAFTRPFYFKPWEAMAEHFGASDEEIVNQGYLDYQEKMYVSGRSILFDFGSCDGFPQVCGPIMSRGKLIGYMGTMAEDADREDVIKANDMIISAISIMANDQQNNWDPAFDLQAFDLDYILGGGSISQAQENAFSARFPPPYVYIVLSSDSEAVSTMRYIQDKMCTKENHTIAAMKSNNYLFMLKYLEPDVLQQSAMIDSLKLTAKQMNLCCGVSDTFSSLAQITAHREQALAAMASGFCSGGPVGVYTFLGQYSNILALAIMEKMGAAACLRPEFKRLLRQDETMGRQNMNTLSEFYSCLGSAAQTAVRMGLHKNTVANRLETIVEETGWDLSDPADSLDIMLQMNITKAAAHL